MKFQNDPPISYFYSREAIVRKKRHTLDFSIDENICLLGIATDEPDYKLCWLINDRLKMGFLKVGDLLVYHRKLQTEQAFPMFIYEDENTMLTYRMIGNKTENGYYLSEIRNIDFIMHVQGEALVTDDLDELIGALNRIPAVRMCVPIDLSKIGERDRLHLW